MNRERFDSPEIFPQKINIEKMKTGDWQRWVVGGIFFALLPLSSGCIDDNMSDCNNFTVRYRIELSTHTQAFSGRMENLNMHFYDGNKSLAYHEYVERERMPSNNIYAITLPQTIITFCHCQYFAGELCEMFRPWCRVRSL